MWMSHINVIMYAPYELTIVFGEVQVRTISLCIEQNVIVKVSCVSLLLHKYSIFLSNEIFYHM